MKKLFEKYRALDPSSRAWIHFVVIGLVILIVGAVILRKMEHPWEGPVAKRLAKGEELRAPEMALKYGFWAGIHVMAVFTGLLISSHWWWKWAEKTGPREPAAPRPRVGRITWIGLGLILLLSIWIRAPQLDRNAHRDEQDALRLAVHGYHGIDKKTGEPRFWNRSWVETIYENTRGNNHTFMSVSSRLSIEVWRKMTGASREYFNLTAMRLPVTLAAVAGIAVLWWLLYLLGLSRAGLIAALLAAVHPMHIEYSVEARGYGWVLLAAPLGGVFLVRALETGRWRHWIGFGGSLFLSLYAYLGSLYFVAALGGMAALVLAWRLWKTSRSQPGSSSFDRARADFVKFAVVGTVSLGTFWVLALPNLMQLLGFWGTLGWTNPLGADFRFVAWTQYFTGSTFVDGWRAYDAGTGRSMMVYLFTKFFPSEPVYASLVFGVMPLLLVLGLVRIVRTGTAAAVWVAASFASALVAYLHQLLGAANLFLYWYMIYLLPAIIAAVAAGLDGVGAWLGQRVGSIRGARAWAPAAVAAVFFGLYLWQSKPGKPGRSHQDSTPHDQVIYFTRGSFNWLVYADGRTISYPADKEVPQEFPW